MYLNKKISKLIESYGSFSSATAFDPGYQIFSDDSIEGCIAYRQEGNYAVVMGNPICSPKDMDLLSKKFKVFCKKQGWNSLYISATDPFVEKAKNLSYSDIYLTGEEYLLDPKKGIPSGSKSRGLRNKLNSAKKMGVFLEEYKEYCLELELKIQGCANRWLNERNGAQIYQMHPHLFLNRENKKWFYAIHNEQVVAIAIIDYMGAKKGWSLSFLIALESAPRGTSEALVEKVLDTLANENACCLSLGTVQRQKIESLKKTHFLSYALVWSLYYTSSPFFKLDQRRKFWKKFQPEAIPSYLVIENRVGIKEIIALTRALNVQIL